MGILKQRHTAQRNLQGLGSSAHFVLGGGEVVDQGVRGTHNKVVPSPGLGQEVRQKRLPLSQAAAQAWVASNPGMRTSSIPYRVKLDFSGSNFTLSAWVDIAA